MRNKDMDAIKHIIMYCEQIHVIDNEFNNSKEKFLASIAYQNAICLSLLQIGELVSVLSEEFKKANSAIPWQKIKAFRNIVAHRYKLIDFNVVWNICLNDIPVFKDFCKTILDNTSEQ